MHDLKVGGAHAAIPGIGVSTVHTQAFRVFCSQLPDAHFMARYHAAGV
jgi:hypothetical protein